MSKARAYYAPKQQETAGGQAAAQQPKKKKGGLRSRAVALIIAAVAVLASTHASVSASLRDLCWDTENIYYGGVYSDDTNSYEPSLYDQLEVRYDSAVGIVSVISDYEELSSECDDFAKAADQLFGAYTPHAECYTNNQLQLSYESLLAALEDVQLSERDAKLFKTYSSDFIGSQRMIEQAAPKYNAAVRELEEELGAFPANYLVGWTDVEIPQAFE